MRAVVHTGAEAGFGIVAESDWQNVPLHTSRDQHALHRSRALPPNALLNISEDGNVPPSPEQPSTTGKQPRL